MLDPNGEPFVRSDDKLVRFLTPVQELQLRKRTPVRQWIAGVKGASGRAIVELDGVRYYRSA